MTFETIGRYRVERKLGAGSFASVWLAFDPELQDLVAIKVLSPVWAEIPDVTDRFIREAQILRRLAGDRIVRIHDIDHSTRGHPYFVMEYADRGSLAERLTTDGPTPGPFPLARAVAVMTGIAKSLRVAHRADVIHRDLKPANVLFKAIPPHDIPTTLARSETALERLMLADFGLARALGTASGQTVNVGTPFYAAPEQFEGRAEARSDLYALAVVGFEMLTGQRPFGGRATDRQNVPDIRRLDRSVPDALAELITRGLDPDPGQRPRDASEWVDILTSVNLPSTGGNPVSGVTESPRRATRPQEAPRQSSARQEPPTRLAPPPVDVSQTRAARGASPAPTAPPVSDASPGDLTPELLATSTWSDADVEAAGIPIIDVPFVTVGGGMGSFIMADYLRIAGVPTDQIKVLSAGRTPWETYEYLTRNSQIPRDERLRSDSSSCPDNIWGFPSYALREAFAARSPAGFLSPIWNVLTEPFARDYYTPLAGQVFEGIAKEADRIRYWEMLELGVVRTVRRRLGGRYFVILTPERGKATTKRVAYRAQHVHLAVGYPGVRFLPDLQAYREKHQDFNRVVAAYEPHEHVYHQLNGRKGTVMVRGAGIVSSRVLQRLIDDRDKHDNGVEIWHVFRNYVSGPRGPLFLRRPGANGFAYQGFNYTKSSWGGQHRQKLLRLKGKERAEFIQTIGGTNTAPRRSWKRQLDRGRREGFYHTWTGEVSEVAPHGERLMTRLHGKDSASLELEVDFIIDATGLEADIRSHRVLADVLDHMDTSPNPVGRLDITPTCVVMGADSPPGRLYASGSATLGGTIAGADSFLGLQLSSLAITDDLAREGFCQSIGLWRSVSQWIKWMRSKTI